MTKQEILATYRKIFRIASRWTALNPENTSTEREYLKSETRNQFRSNLQETDPLKVRAFLQDAEKKIAIAKHYGIPYDKPAYLPPSTSYGTFKPRSMSTSSRKPSKSDNLRKVTIETFRLLPDEIKKFALCYMAGAPLSTEELNKLPECLRLNEILDLLLSCEIRNIYPGKQVFERNLFKIVIRKLESCNVEISDVLYNKLCEAMVSTEENVRFFHRIFLDVENEHCFVIRENCEQISNGTTGLATWHASICMAEFIRCGMIGLSSKQLNVLELGSGCGLAGICAGKYLSQSLTSLVLTDGNMEVLKRLKQNVLLNYDENSLDGADDAGGLKIFVELLDFTSYDLSNLPAVPDIVLASDVVYDLEIIPSLCSLLNDLLGISDGTVAFVSCTIRNSDTVATFVNSVEQKGLSIHRKHLYVPGSNAFVVSSINQNKENQERKEFEPIFPVCSLPTWPTVIFEISK